MNQACVPGRVPSGQGLGFQTLQRRSCLCNKVETPTLPHRIVLKIKKEWMYSVYVSNGTVDPKSHSNRGWEETLQQLFNNSTFQAFSTPGTAWSMVSTLVPCVLKCGEVILSASQVNNFYFNNYIFFSMCIRKKYIAVMSNIWFHVQWHTSLPLVSFY